jgi:Ca-activated chloride channel homolog
MFRFLVVSFVFTLGSVFTTLASEDRAEQEPQISPRQRKSEGLLKRSAPNLRLDVRLILVPVSVTDALDRPITTLSQESFRLLEDDVEQRITSFTREEAPVSLGLLLDVSGSMKNRIAASVEALKLFFQTTMPGDEFFVVQFNDEPRLLGGFTTNPDEIFGRLGFVRPIGWTALLDAVAMANHQMKHAKNHRRVLLILSDGNDNNSRFSESEIKSMVLEGDLRIYGIGISYRPHLLQQLGEVTGGKVLVAQNIGELPDVVQRLSAEIRSQYMLGYTSSNTFNDGKYHRVKVELLQPRGIPPLRASWRRGYYAPSQ